jgi:hypothetical protein
MKFCGAEDNTKKLTRIHTYFSCEVHMKHYSGWSTTVVTVP